MKNQKKLTQQQRISRLEKVVSQLHLSSINTQKSLVNMAKILKDNNINHIDGKED